jgi:circadian clock protein KaiB
MKKQPPDKAKKVEKSVTKPKQTMYVLKLYIAGVSLKSTQAITNIKQICDEHLKGRCDLEVIDIYQQPVLAKGEQIIAVPTLIKKLPPPLRRFIGNLADSERILFGLDLQSRREPSQKK